MKKLILAILFCFLCVTQVNANDSNDGFSIIFKDSHWGMSVSDVKKMMKGYELIKDEKCQDYGIKGHSLDYKCNNTYGIHTNSTIHFYFFNKNLAQVSFEYDAIDVSTQEVEFKRKVHRSIRKYCNEFPAYVGRDFVEVDIDNTTQANFFIRYDSKPILVFENKKVTDYFSEIIKQWKPVNSFIDGYRIPNSEYGIMNRMLISTIKEQERYVKYGNWKQRRDAKHNMELCEEFEKLWEETVIKCEKARDKGDQETCVEEIIRFQTKTEGIMEDLRKIN